MAKIWYVAKNCIHSPFNTMVNRHEIWFSPYMARSYYCRVYSIRWFFLRLYTSWAPGPSVFVFDIALPLSLTYCLPISCRYISRNIYSVLKRCLPFSKRYIYVMNISINAITLVMGWYSWNLKTHQSLCIWWIYIWLYFSSKCIIDISLHSANG